MCRFIQALESRRLLSASPPSQAVLAAMAKLTADMTKFQTDAANFQASIAVTNSTFLTAKAAELAAIKADLADHNQQQLALDRQKLKNDVTAHTTGLKTDVANWKTTHQADMTTIHNDIVALQQARKASH